MKKSGKSGKLIKRDFTKNDSRAKAKASAKAKKPNYFPAPQAKKEMNESDKKKLLRISEMMKQESIHFCKRLEKQIRILADVSGLSSTSPFRFDLTSSGKF